jgi:perosamine synthetase
VNNVNSFIPWYQPSFWGKEKEYVLDALNSTWISGGEYVAKFEQWFSRKLDTEHAIAVSNGTTALHLIYLALGLQQGDEIIIPGFGFLAAANIALHLGCKPVFAEVNPETWCISPHDVENKITKKTRAIIAIHTYGNLCNLDSLKQLAQKHNVYLIEDCAESIFSKYGHHYCGTFGFASSFSFQATKTITTGEGGLVITQNTDLYDKMRLFHSHGLKTRGTYQHELAGHNFRITNMQAAIGYGQIEHADEIITKKNKIYNTYKSYLSAFDGIYFQRTEEHSTPVWWVFALQLDKNAFPQGRNTVIKQLLEKGIETRPGFVASSQLKYFNAHHLPVCETLSDAAMSLPSFPAITEEAILFICKALMELKI